MQRISVLNQFEKYKDKRIETGIEANRKGTAYLEFVDSEGNPVKDVAVEVKQKTHEFRYGANLFMLDEMESTEKNELYKKYFAESFNIATLPFYWKDIEPVQNRSRYDINSPKIYRRPAPDLCLEYCKEHNIEPKAHCLNYVPYTPDWVPSDIDSKKYYLEKRFSELADRYSGNIPSWEVTNETLFVKNDDPFYNMPDLVEWSFELAEKYFKHNKLIINDAHCNIWNVFNGNRSSYYMQIERALNKGARIDSIGMQYHMFYKREDELKCTENEFYNPVHIYSVLDRYSDFSLPIQITELTIPAYSHNEEDEEIQAEIIKYLYSIWFSHPAMEAIIYWNLVDGYAAFAPQGDMNVGENCYYGGLVWFDLTPKPAYKVIKELFGKTWRTNELIKGDGELNFKGFYGLYDLKIYAKGMTYDLKIDLLKKNCNKFRIVL